MRIERTHYDMDFSTLLSLRLLTESVDVLRYRTTFRILLSQLKSFETSADQYVSTTLFRIAGHGKCLNEWERVFRCLWVYPV